MDSRLYSFKSSRRLFAFTVGIVSLFILTSALFSRKSLDRTVQEGTSSSVLRKIYEEVAALEHIENDSIVKGEFHIDLDGDEDNKEEHIVVLNHCAEGQQKMLLQVTYYETRRKNSPVKYAKCIREIECCIYEDRVEIERCDYDRLEINSILAGILEGIRVKKKILELIEDRT